MNKRIKMCFFITVIALAIMCIFTSCGTNKKSDSSSVKTEYTQDDAREIVEEKYKSYLTLCARIDTGDQIKEVLLPTLSVRLYKPADTYEKYYVYNCTGGKVRNCYGQIILVDTADNLYYVNKKTGEITSYESDTEEW